MSAMLATSSSPDTVADPMSSTPSSNCGDSSDGPNGLRRQQPIGASPPLVPTSQYHRSASMLCGGQVWSQQPQPLGQPMRKLDEEHTVFRPRPITAASGEYCANSYIGWHQTVSRMNHPVWNGSALDLAYGGSSLCGPPVPASAPGGLYGTPNGSGMYGQPTMSGLMPSCSSFNGAIEQQPQQQQQHPSQDDDSGRSFLSNKSWSICLCTMVLVIVVAVLVAMTVTVLSQVKSHNSVIKLVRQYRGHFLVTDGPLMNFEPKLLDESSAQFQLHARKFETRLDEMFRLSGLQSIYEGSEVTSFRFIVEVPGLEVNFHVKTKVEAELTARDLLTVIDDGLRHNFPDARIDTRTLTLENQQLN